MEIKQQCPAQIVAEENVMESRNSIHWDIDNPKKLDLEYYSTIGKLANMILYGGCITQIWAIINVLFSADRTVYTVIPTLLEGALYLCLSVMAYRALVQGKKNAIFLSRALLIICLLSWLISFVFSAIFNPDTIPNFINLWGLLIVVWCISGLIWTYVDEEIKEVFPESYRQHSLKELLFVVCVPFVPILLNVFLSITAFRNEKNNFISNFITSANKECPIEYEWGGVLTKTEYNNNRLVFIFLVDEDEITIAKLKDNQDLIKNSYIQTFQCLPSSHPLSNKVMAELGIDLIFLIKGESGSFDFLIKSEDIKNSTNTKPTPYGLLKTKIQILNMFLPNDVDDGIQFVGADLKGRSLTYKYILDEDLYDMSAFNQSKNDVYNNIHDEFWGNIDDEFNSLCNRCLDKIDYIYTGKTSSQSIKFTLSLKSR